jgi:hypothetical protein
MNNSKNNFMQTTCNLIMEMWGEKKVKSLVSVHANKPWYFSNEYIFIEINEKRLNSIYNLAIWR